MTTRGTADMMGAIMLRFIVVLAVCIITVFRSGAAGPDDSYSVMVGNRRITVPYPEGFVRCDGVNEAFDAAAAQIIPPPYRLLAYFASPEDLQSLKDATGVRHRKSFTLQALRSFEREDVGERTFAGMRDGIKAGLDKASVNSDAEIKKAAEEGSARLKKEFGDDADPGVSVTGSSFLGYFEDSGSAIGFTVALKTKEGDDEGKEVSVRSLAVVLLAPVNGRLLGFSANFPYESEADRAAAQKAVSAWRDAVVTANPRVAGPDAPESRDQALGRGIATLTVFIAIPVILYIVTRKKKTAAAAGSDLTPPE